MTDYSLTIKSADGKLTDVLYNASVYKDDKGVVLGVFAAAREYTRVKKATEVLQSSNKELEAFSYSVSHDLRAPLRQIDGFSKILFDDYSPKLEQEGQQIISSIRQSAKLMGRLIDDLLAFSRIGREEMTIGNVEMSEMAKMVFNELKLALPDRNITLHVGELSRVKVDSALIKQVWTNLFSNALKFTTGKKEAVIDVACNTENGEIVYAVKDNGAGFDMKYVDKLFEVFQRLHSQEEFEGTGVGLGIVKRIIERHGGRVWAEGAVDHGATFYFALPVSSLSNKS